MNRFSLSERLADADGEYTFLAPIDAAFEKTADKLEVPLEDFLNDADTIVGILENHILDKVYEGSDLKEERSAELISQNGSTIALETNSKGTTIDLFAKGSAAKVLKTDIDLACSAAVHKVSGLLLPFSTGQEGKVIGECNLTRDAFYYIYNGVVLCESKMSGEHCCLELKTLLSSHHGNHVIIVPCNALELWTFTIYVL